MEILSARFFYRNHISPHHNLRSKTKHRGSGCTVLQTVNNLCSFSGSPGKDQQCDSRNIPLFEASTSVHFIKDHAVNAVLGYKLLRKLEEVHTEHLAWYRGCIPRPVVSPNSPTTRVAGDSAASKVGLSAGAKNAVIRSVPDDKATSFPLKSKLRRRTQVLGVVKMIWTSTELCMK